MAIPISGTLESAGKFPLVNAADVLMPDNSRLSEVDFSGGGGSATKTPTSIDLTRYATDGVIVEHYADGSTVTHTMEFNAVGKPIKITSGDTEITLTW